MRSKRIFFKEELVAIFVLIVALAFNILSMHSTIKKLHNNTTNVKHIDMLYNTVYVSVFFNILIVVAFAFILLYFVYKKREAIENVAKELEDIIEQKGGYNPANVHEELSPIKITLNKVVKYIKSGMVKRENLEKINRQMSFILGLLEGIATTINIDTLVSTLISYFQSYSDFWGIAVYIKQENVFKIRGASPSTSIFPSLIMYSVDNAIIQNLNIEVMYQNKAYYSIISIPFYKKGDVIGLVAIFDTSQREQRIREELFINNDKMIFNIASIISVGIQNAILYEQAILANKLKGEFITNISHEIRTPLTTIIGYSELLLKRTQDVECRGNVDTIIKSSYHLLNIVNDIIEISRIEAGDERLKFEYVDIKSVIDEAIAPFYDKAKEKGIYLKAVYKKAIPSKILLDKEKIIKIVNNLVSNAVKFTAQGGIKVMVGYEDIDIKNGYLYIVVSDTGIGIEKDKLQIIFDPFYQVRQSITKKTTGTGLGLAIAKGLVKILDGRMKVFSIIGKGSIFGIRIVVRKENSEPQRMGEPLFSNVLKGKKILAVDDNSYLLDYLSMIIKENGGDIIVDRGVDAIRLCKMTVFDIVFLDIILEEQSGIDICQSIRQIKGYENKPIIALTGSINQEKLEALKDKGFDDYLIKPFGNEEVKRIILKHLWGVGKKEVSVL